MRTLQEKYNAIQEGKFSKEHFLVEARMQQPHLITRFNGYNDAVQILKNRGMIKENINFSEYSNDALTDMITNLSRYENNEREIQSIKDELARRKGAVKEGNLGHNEISSIHPEGAYWIVTYRGPKGTTEKSFKSEKEARGFQKSLNEVTPAQEKYRVKTPTPFKQDIAEARLTKNRGMIQEAASFKFSDLKQGSIIQNKFSGKKYTVIAVRDKSADIQQGDDGRETEIASLNNYELINEARLTKNNLTDYRYKPTNEMDKYPYEQILRGIRVELETMGVQGTPTAEEYAKALAKVSKNLAKDSIFYTNQLAGVNPKVDLHDKMVDATAKNTVDTFNGMKKIKDLKEDHTKDPDDKYTVKFSKTNNTYQVWEGDHLVTDFTTKERAKAYADKKNIQQGLTESVLKEGIKNLIKKALMENNEDIFEMQGPKSDAEYKRELENYLDDNQIYGYTDMLFDILTAPDEEQVADNLADFLDDHQIYGYNRGLLTIFRDYSNRNYPDNEDDIDYDDENFSDPMIDGEDLFESISLKDIL